MAPPEYGELLEARGVLIRVSSRMPLLCEHRKLLNGCTDTIYMVMLALEERGMPGPNERLVER